MQNPCAKCTGKSVLSILRTGELPTNVIYQPVQVFDGYFAGDEWEPLSFPSAAEFNDEMGGYFEGEISDVKQTSVTETMATYTFACAMDAGTFYCTVLLQFPTDPDSDGYVREFFVTITEKSADRELAKDFGFSVK